MKTGKLISFVIISAVLFSSCKNNMQLTKRHYTKGYYFHKNKSIEQAEVKEGLASTTSKQIPPAPTEMLNLKANPSNKQVETNENKTSKTVVASSAKKAIHASKPAKQAASQEEKSLNNVKKELQAQSKTQSKKTASSGDKDLIVQIILSLFPILCLIAVYLHDGKGITLNFWIDLILHITVFGECIFAILVVLDIINLA